MRLQLLLIVPLLLGQLTYPPDSVSVSSTDVSGTKNLIDNTSVDMATVDIPDFGIVSGVFRYTAYARDTATNVQVFHGWETYICTNNTGDEACSNVLINSYSSVSKAGSLVCGEAWTYGTNQATVSLDCDTDLSSTTEFFAKWTFTQYDATVITAVP